MFMMSVEMKPGTGCHDCDTEHLQGRTGKLSLQCERNLSIIRRQCEEIEELKQELDKVVTERDMLLCEVSKLKFDIQVVDLRRTISDHNEGGVSVTVGCNLHRVSSEMAGYMNNNNNCNNNNNNATWTQQPIGNLHKKGSMNRENGEVLKRSRLQTAYELSQDLLDKQIEMLERKYGGVKARNAALTIQRAFRRHTLLKKFATITAMAKAEKRLSRRLAEPTDGDGSGGGGKYHPHMGMGVASYRHPEETRPLRSMSMRERRNVDVMPLVRSQSGRCNADGAECYCPNGYCPNHTHGTHYYMSEEVFADSTEFAHENFTNRTTLVRRTIATSPLTSTNCWQGVGMGQDSGMPRSGSSCSNHSYPFRGSARGGCPGGGSISIQGQHCHKVPPEVPKRTSSISSRGPMEPARPRRTNRLSKSRENGSLSSVQSSGSDSSLSTDRVTCESSEGDNHRGSPIWKRKGQSDSPDHQDRCAEYPLQELSRSHTSAAYQLPLQDHASEPSIASQHTISKVSETVRKRQYRVGLNLFNKKPEKGVAYLIRRGFLENSPSGVSRFLISRKGLSKQMIGEYLGNLQNAFNMAVLDCFSQELDFSEMQVDVALRRYQTYFRMPGEAQKIERLMEVFGQRYCQCERDLVTALRSPDTVFVLAFAIIMLNTDLHTPNIKPERRMKLDDFIKNLRGIDDGADIDRDMLVGIYERVKLNEFKPGSDHVTQVMKVQSTIVGKKPNMALPHRRLVCYCRLYEIPDVSKKERPGVHQREVFLFNDLLVITKILSKKKSSVTYTFRQSFALCGMSVTLFEAQHYQYGIRLCQRVDNKLLVTFNARNEHDRCKFAEDLRESISEMDEMENLRIDTELERQKSSRGGRSGGASSSENRDSGVADVEGYPCSSGSGGGLTPQGLDEDEAGGHHLAGGLTSGGQHVAQQLRTEARLTLETPLKRSALSNSLLDIHEQCDKPQQRRGSMGSLDSGMSISFQSMTTSTLNQDAASPQNHAKSGAKVMVHQQSFLGGLFAKRERKTSRTEEGGPFGSRSTEV